MCGDLGTVVASARAVVAALDVSALTASEAASAFESFAELECLGAAGKLLTTPAVAKSEAWAKAGYRSAEEWMAAKSGSSVGAAKAAAETAKRVAELPATAEALKLGELSLAQVAAVSEAAAAAPDKEAELLEVAAKETVRTLQQRSREVVLESRGTVEERYARQRKLRSFSSWTDDEGMSCGKFRLTPDAGASVLNRIRQEADRQYRRAYSEGRRETPENYAADAMVALINGEAAGSSKGSEVVVHVSYDALRRGFVNPDSGDGEAELCEVPGFGAVPVSRARDLLADAFLKAVVIDGTRVSHVKHFGRHRPAEIDTALQARTVVQRGAVVCDVDGCDRSVGLEWDHTQDFAKGGETSEANLRPLCRFHHREKTAGRLVRKGTRWIRASESAGSRAPP